MSNITMYHLQDLEHICSNGFQGTHKTWLMIILCCRSLREFPSCFNLLCESGNYEKIFPDFLKKNFLKKLSP